MPLLYVLSDNPDLAVELVRKSCKMSNEIAVQKQPATWLLHCAGGDALQKNMNVLLDEQSRKICTESQALKSIAVSKCTMETG